MPVLLALLLAAAPPPETGRGLGAEQRVPFRLGVTVGGGLGVRAPWLLGAGEASFLVEVPFSQRLALRMGLGFRAGAAEVPLSFSSPVPALGGQLVAEARLHLVSVLFLGGGVEVGYLNVDSSRFFEMVFLAPTLTVAARFGERRQHELALSGALLAFENVWSNEGDAVLSLASFGSGGLGLVRYTFLF